MTESSILPGGVPGGGGGGVGVPTPYGFDDEPGGGDRRRLMILGGIAGVVVLLLAAYLLLHGSGGGSSNDSSTGLVPRGTPNAAVSPSPSSTSGGNGTKPQQSPGTKLPPKSHTRLARDPFKALFSTAPPSAGGGAATGTDTGETGTGGAPVTVTTVGPEPVTSTGTVIPGGPSEGGTPSSGTGGVTTQGDPIWVELISTNGVKDAVFDVGYQAHKFRRFTVSAPAAGSTAGTIFDDEFSLLSIQGRQVTLQVGDDTPFDLHEGVEHELV
jgi:hypothetical protein